MFQKLDTLAPHFWFRFRSQFRFVNGVNSQHSFSATAAAAAASSEFSRQMNGLIDLLIDNFSYSERERERKRISKELSRILQKGKENEQIN